MAASTDGSLLDALRTPGLIEIRDEQALAALHRSAEGRAVMLQGLCQPTDEAVTLLAAGFALGDVGAPAIPYARIEE